MKTDGRLTRCPLKGTTGDALFAVLCACGHNIRKILAHLRAPLALLITAKRHGTTTLFAALNVLDGNVIGRNMQRHRHQEFIRFLNAIEAAVPAGSQVHAILDNYAAHKHPKVRPWLDRHPRWTFHFVPTSCSWLNAVEGFFAKLSKRRLKRGAFHSIVDLQAASTVSSMSITQNRGPSPRMLVAIALANKMARIIWAILVRNEDYRDPAGSVC